MVIGERELRLRLPADPRAVGEARDTVQGALARAPEAVCEDVRLLVSELVTNSLRHGGLRPGDEVRVALKATPTSLRVEVTDQGRGFDPDDVSRPPPGAPGGYGLELVRLLAHRWGVIPNGGINVWFEFDRPFESR